MHASKELSLFGSSSHNQSNPVFQNVKTAVIVLNYIVDYIDSVDDLIFKFLPRIK